MLLLSRGIGETVVAGNGADIPFMDVTILKVNGNKVLLGIKAPKNIPVNRQEIHERIIAEENTSQYSCSAHKEEVS